MLSGAPPDTTVRGFGLPAHRARFGISQIASGLGGGFIISYLLLCDPDSFTKSLPSFGKFRARLRVPKAARRMK